MSFVSYTVDGFLSKFRNLKLKFINCIHLYSNFNKGYILYKQECKHGLLTIIMHVHSLVFKSKILLLYLFCFQDHCTPFMLAVRGGHKDIVDMWLAMEKEPSMLLRPVCEDVNKVYIYIYSIRTELLLKSLHRLGSF